MRTVHAHLVGIAARGMSGLAQILVERGVVVSGSAKELSPTLQRLRRLGIRVHAGHAPWHFPESAELLFHDPEIARDDPERLTAARRGIDQKSPAQWFSSLMRKRHGVVVAGQRDASMASAMIGWVLTRAALDPTVVLGTLSTQLGGWARLGQGAHFVVEAVGTRDELGPHAPKLAVTLNVEPRAANLTGTGERLRDFVASVPSDGLVLALGPSQLTESAVKGIASEVEWLSLERGSAWWGADLREERGRYRFRAFHHGRFAVEVKLQVPGRRNVVAALATVAVCDRLQVPIEETKQALEEFEGVSRDFESRGSYRGVTLVDDESADVSSVSETLCVGRQVFGGRRLWVVFHPPAEGLSFEAVEAYAAALAPADHVLVVNGAVAGPGGADPIDLIQRLTASGVQARGTASLDDAILELDRHLEPGDVLLTLGAGDVGTISDAFIRRLPRDRQDR